MRYISNGQTRTGTVWSPGPLANSLWVLDDETGDPVVVKVPKGKVSAAHEYDYALPTIVEGTCGMKWVTGPEWRNRYGSQPAPYTWAADYRGSGRKLPEKVWRAAVGDQCEQLELTAA